MKAFDSDFPQPYLFPLMPSYWISKKHQVKVVKGDTLAALKKESYENNSIIMHKVSKTFKATSAVKEYSNKFVPGNLYAVLGMNGAGKSTIIAMLSGVLKPTHGQIYMFGMDMNHDDTKIRRLIGCCDQKDYVYPALNCLQHIELYSRFKGCQYSVESAIQLLKSVKLDDVARQRVGAFSGGMKRRLSLILAFVGDSKLILLDEPVRHIFQCLKYLFDLIFFL